MSNTTLTNNLRNELAPKSSSQGWSKLSISLASIIKVYAEELRCDIKVVQGEKDEPIYSGVEIILELPPINLIIFCIEPIFPIP